MSLATCAALMLSAVARIPPSAAKVDRRVEKATARIILSGYPTGTEIYVDGQLLGVGRVDQSIAPGTHVIRFAAENYLSYQVTTDIRPDDTFALSKTLEPTTWQGVKLALHSAQENIYNRNSTFVVSFETMTLTSAVVDARQHTAGSELRTTRLLSPDAGSARLNGFSAEYAATGRYIGLMVIGAAYSQASSKPWKFALNSAADPDFSTINTKVDMLTVRALQPQVRLAIWQVTLGLQVGFEVRGFRIQEQVTPEHYPDGFLFVDTQLAGQFALRCFLFDGLFLQGAYRRTWTVASITGGRGPGMQGFLGGLGYAF